MNNSDSQQARFVWVIFRVKSMSAFKERDINGEGKTGVQLFGYFNAAHFEKDIYKFIGYRRLEYIELTYK